MSDHPDEGDETEWRYSVDEVGAEVERTPDPIEPGSPSAENVAFFLLGVGVTVGALGVLIFG